jgi:phospholipid transport system substrate-binding protein
MIRRLPSRQLSSLFAALLAAASFAVAAQTAPDALIQKLSTEVIDTVKADKAIQGGDVAKVIALVDSKVMPHVNFEKMTARAVGQPWRSATPDQKSRLQAEFKTLLVRTYAGALTQVKDQDVALKPFRGNAADEEVVVRTEVKGKGEPIQLDYRLEKAGDGWKIIDVNVVGVWLVGQYQNTFKQWAAEGGVDGLIAKLAERNAKAKG